MNDMTRRKMVDTLNTAVTICDLAKQERATAGFDTLESSKAALESALADRRNACEALAAYDAA
jgi:hypothetical protein